MKKSRNYRVISILLFIIVFTGALFLNKPIDTEAAYTRYVTAYTLSIRAKGTSKSKIVGFYTYGKKLTCYGSKLGWTKIKYNGAYRYVGTAYLSSKKVSSTNTVIHNTNTTTTNESYVRYVTAATLNVRAKGSSASTVVGFLKKGTKLTCYGNKLGWTKIKYNGNYRYVGTAYLSSKSPVTGSTGGSVSVQTPSSVSGQEIVDYAKSFLGNPYLWGGTSLTKGADCSGFTQSVYAHFGYKIPRVSVDQRTAGKAVSYNSIQKGDLVCYKKPDGTGHVAIYMGNDRVIHAANAKRGITTDAVNFYTIVTIRRIIQ